jgi:hypothetical protein
MISISHWGCFQIDPTMSYATLQECVRDFWWVHW